MAAGVYAEHGEYDSLFLSNYLDVFVKDALKRVPGVGRRHRSSASASTRCGCGSIRRGWRRAGSPRGDVDAARCASRTCRSRPAAVGQPPARAGQIYQISVRAAGRLSEPSRVRQHHRQGRRRRLARPAEGRRPRRARRRDLRRATCASRASRRSASASSSCRRPTRSTSYDHVLARARAAVEASFPPGLQVPDRVRHDDGRQATRSARC